MDQEKRVKLMQEGFFVAMEEVAWVPLHVPKLTYGVAEYSKWKPRADMIIKVDEVGFE